MTTPFTEEQKEKNREKMRRNFRILALIVAAYYFITAGMSYYEEMQREKLDENIEASESISNAAIFRQNFNKYLTSQDTALPIANANDTTEGFVAPLSTALEIKGYNFKDSKSIESVELQARYPEALPPDALIALKAFIAACENTSDEQYIKEIIMALGIVPEFDKNEDNKVFKDVQMTTGSRTYTLSFKAGDIDELTLKAQ